MLQHFRSINVLPPGTAYIDGSDLVIAGHQSNAVSKAAIVPAALGFCSLEIAEDFHRAHKQADIDRIVIPQVFPDADDPVSASLDFHRIFQIENGPEFSIHRDVEVTGVKRIKQTTDDRAVENMIAHREEKACADMPGGNKKRDAILLLPLAVFNERCPHTGRNHPFDLCDHALALIADDEMDCLDLDRN